MFTVMGVTGEVYILLEICQDVCKTYGFFVFTFFSQEAVLLALSNSVILGGDLALAKHVAEIHTESASDLTTDISTSSSGQNIAKYGTTVDKKKIWLLIACHVVEKTNGMDYVGKFVYESYTGVFMIIYLY